MLKAAAVLVVLAASVAYAQPPKYTLESNNGLTLGARAQLYSAIRKAVDPVAKALGLNEAENQCARMTLGEALVRVTVEALKGDMFGLDGADEALHYFQKGQEDWCSGQGGKRGAEAIAPRASQAQSFLRPFLKERFAELHSRNLTPGEAAVAVAAAFAAALVALPALAPL